MKFHISRDVIFEEGKKWELKIKEDEDDEGHLCFSPFPNLMVDDFEQEVPIP